MLYSLVNFTYQGTLLISILCSSIYYAHQYTLHLLAYSVHQCTPLINVLLTLIYSTKCTLFRVRHSVYSTQYTPLILLHSSMYSAYHCTPLSLLHLVYLTEYTPTQCTPLRAFYSVYSTPCISLSVYP